MVDFKRSNKQGLKRRNSGGFRNRSGRRDFDGSKDRFDRENPDRNRDGSGRKDFGRPERNRDLEMFDIICDKCGKKSQVPFKPTSSKPVFCRDCFRRNGNSDSRGNSGRPSQEFVEINNKLDKIMKALDIDP